MSIGASWAGIDTIVAFDADVHAAKTYQMNHPETKVICDDVRNITDFSVFRPKEPFVLFGGPPCQGFSTSNQRTRNVENKNNWLFQEFLRSVEQLNPDWVVFENVRGILETANAAFLNYVVHGLESLGYAVNYGLLNAADFGVPQKRHRLFILGSKNGTKLDLPMPNCTSYITVGDAISDLQNLPNGANFKQLEYKCAAQSDFAKKMRNKKRVSFNHHVTRNAPHIIERYKYIPQGGNWEDVPDKLMGTYADKSRCHTGIYRRLKNNEPSVVIGNYRKNMLIHPTEDRGLSVREAARLQSFPDNYQFYGSIGFQQQQVGNAVPPLLAKAVFERLNY